MMENQLKINNHRPLMHLTWELWLRRCKKLFRSINREIGDYDDAIDRVQVWPLIGWNLITASPLWDAQVIHLMRNLPIVINSI